MNSSSNSSCDSLPDPRPIQNVLASEFVPVALIDIVLIQRVSLNCFVLCGSKPSDHSIIVRKRQHQHYVKYWKTKFVFEFLRQDKNLKTVYDPISQNIVDSMVARNWEIVEISTHTKYVGYNTMKRNVRVMI